MLRTSVAHKDIGWNVTLKICVLTPEKIYDKFQ